MSRFLLEAALVIQLARQRTETLTRADSLRRLPAAECGARILQTLREQISAPLAPLECVMRARRWVRLECIDVHLECRKLAGSFTCSRDQWARLRHSRNRVRPAEQVDEQGAGLAIRELGQRFDGDRIPFRRAASENGGGGEAGRDQRARDEEDRGGSEESGNGTTDYHRGEQRQDVTGNGSAPRHSRGHCSTPNRASVSRALCVHPSASW